MQYLVLGANGYIGSYLYNRMQIEGLNVVGTGHLRAGAGELINFDVQNDSVSDVLRLIMDKDKVAIFCIAQTNIDRCKTEYELSKWINVICAKKIINILMQENFHVIYFSTDNVFDGIKGDYTELDKTKAINQYGKMKEEMEYFLMDNYPEACIFRLPKVVGVEKERQNLLTDLESKIKDKEVKCISGSRMSIVSKEDIYQACLISAKMRLHGLYNLSSGDIYSRKQFAERFYKYMGIDDVNIIELELDKFGFKEKRPLKINLDSSKFKEKTGYEFMSFDTIIKQYLDMV